jgi:hypothetical protein
MKEFKHNIINKLKFIFDNTNEETMAQFTSLSDAYEKSKQLVADSNSKSPPKESKEDPILEEIKLHKENYLRQLFKKTQLIFGVLSDLLKYVIIKVDDERYKNAYDEKINFPNNTDKLILVIGCYGEAFDSDISETLYNLVNLDCFSDLQTIGNIHQNMIPFVATNELDLNSFNKDYDMFSDKVRNFACDVLEVNTDFEEASLLYVSDYEEEDEEELSMRNMIMEEVC